MRGADRAGRALAAAVDAVHPPDQAAAAAAARLQDRLVKPPGALGRLEALGARLAGMAGSCPPPVPAPATVAVFAADHGVVAEGVTPWPQEVTAEMVATFARGRAAVNVLAEHVGAEVVVVDVGVASPVRDRHVLDRKVRAGTANLAVEAAMTEAEALRALDVGVEVARRCVAQGARCLVTAEMGIGNTTAASALVAALAGRPAAEVTGLGAGADHATMARKVAVVERAVARAAGARGGALQLLAEVGGLEIAALAGFVVGGAAAGVPVLLDGLIAGAGALVAAALAPGAPQWCVAGHRSPEPGAGVALDRLGLEPVLDLGMRLGEGTGALLALPVVQAAAKVLREMGTLKAPAAPQGAGWSLAQTSSRLTMEGLASSKE